jgi:hypothetical protein
MDKTSAIEDRNEHHILLRIYVHHTYHTHHTQAEKAGAGC